MTIAMKTSPHRSPRRTSAVCQIVRFMDLLDKDVHEFADHKEPGRACREMLLKYGHFSGTQWVYVLGRLVCSAYAQDRRDAGVSSQACQFRQMLDLFHADIHGLTGQEEDDDLEDAFQQVWDDHKHLTRAEWIRAVGELAFFFYHDDPRLRPPEKATA